MEEWATLSHLDYKTLANEIQGFGLRTTEKEQRDTLPPAGPLVDDGKGRWISALHMSE